MIQVRRLGHATLATPDLEAQTDYYSRMLGLGIIEKDAIACRSRLQHDGCVLRELLQCCCVVLGRALAHGLEREGTVHGAGL